MTNENVGNTAAVIEWAITPYLLNRIEKISYINQWVDPPGERKELVHP